MGIGKLGIIQKQLKVEVNQHAHRICAKTGGSFDSKTLQRLVSLIINSKVASCYYVNRGFQY